MKKHAFSIDAAERVGINAAVLLDHLAFWVRQNGAAGRNIRDGAAWTYGSVREIAERFPYFSEKQVRGALDRLMAAGLIQSGNYNKMRYDRTRWYTLTLEGERLTSEGREDSPSEAKGDAGKVEPIPSKKADINNRLKHRADALRARLNHGA